MMIKNINLHELENLVAKRRVKATILSLKMIYLTIVLYCNTSICSRTAPYIKAIRKKDLKKLEKHGCILLTTENVFITKTGEHIASFFLELENGR